MLRDSLQGFYYSLQVFYKALPENEKTFLYIKLRQTKYVYSPFLLPSSVLQLFFSFSVSSLFGTHQQLTHPPVKSSTLPLWKNHVFWGYCFFNVLTSFCLGSLWFGAHPYYLLNLYLHLYYVWSISIAKVRHYPKTLFYVWSISIAKDRRIAEKCSPRLQWS